MTRSAKDVNICIWHLQWLLWISVTYICFLCMITKRGGSPLYFNVLIYRISWFQQAPLYIFFSSINEGDKFAGKDFHDQILRIGPVGLDTLEEIVDDWMTSLLPPLVANPIQSFNSSSVATNINSNHVINVFISLCITGYMLLCCS